MADTTISIELRSPADADRDAIAEIWHGGASLPYVGPLALPSKEDLRKRVDEEFSGGWNVTLAIHEGEPVGFVATKPIEAILAELFVKPSLTGGGIGQALLNHAKSSMSDGFTLYTRSANTGARRFYEREGLQVLREGIHPRSSDPITYYTWKSGGHSGVKRLGMDPGSSPG